MGCDIRAVSFLVAIMLWQPTTSTPQVATIMAVKPHPGASDVLQYDVSVKVDNVSYVILYTPPNGSTGAEYAVGQNLIVQVGTSSMVFTKFGRTFEVPILSRQNISASTEINWSQATGNYFSQKLDHLSDKLSLTAEQQAKIRPILEQEAGEAREVIGTSVFSKKDKLKRLERIVRISDSRLKPILSADQWQRLLSIRKQQRSELTEWVNAKTSSQ